ncbi:hypothetical protein ACP4OV_025411 [Aristida adscensionis]
MGSCVSRSSASTAAAEPAHASTATVVDMDGAVARFAAPVTASEALAAAAAGGGGRASSSSYFLCGADELDFDAPARAMGAGDALRPGELYFALPLSMLRRPLSGPDMAALAVKAVAALGAAPVGVGVDAGRPGAAASVSSRGIKSAAGETRQRRRRAGRVAPLLGAVAGDGGSAHGGDGGYGDARRVAAYGGGDRTVGKTRNAAGYRGGTRAAVPVQRLSVLVEADSE